MGQTQDKLIAAKRISDALAEWVETDEKSQVHVFESAAGNLRAVVGSRRFNGMNPVQRQEEIWRFLESKLAKDELLHLFGVHAKDATEYAADEFRWRSSAAVDLFIRGAENGKRNGNGNE